MQQLQDARGFNAKLSNFRLPEDAHELSFTVLKKRDQQYIAPEVIQTRVMTRKAEVFAFGVIMWELWHNMFFGSFVDQQAQPNRCASQLPCILFCSSIVIICAAGLQH